MATSFLVSSLPAYVQTNRDIIIKNFALVGTETRRRIGLQTGVKKDAYLNYLSLAATLQDGSGCGFNALDEFTVSQRVIETAAIKVDGQICPESLLGKYAEYLVRIAATENELPFEQYIVDTIVAELNKKVEKLIWQGDTTSNDADLKWIDGFLAQFAADSDVLTESIANGSTASQGIMQVYLSIPEEAAERGAVIFVSPDCYRKFIAGLVASNLYHYAGPVNEFPSEFVLPGTNALVVKTPGLASTLNIVGTFADNLVYGTDGENDNELVDLWWSQDDRLFKYQVKWNSGVAYHFPDQVVLGTFAATPGV